MPEMKKVPWLNPNYTISYIDVPVDELVKKSEIPNLVPAPVDSHTKAEVNTALAAKADTSAVNTSLATKADKTTTYTKAEVDTALGNKADKSSAPAVGAWTDVPDSWFTGADFPIFAGSKATITKYFAAPVNMLGVGAPQYRIDGNSICFRGFLARDHRKNDGGNSFGAPNDPVPLSANTVADFSTVMRLPVSIDGIDFRLCPTVNNSWVAPNYNWKRPSYHCGPTVPSDYRHPSTTNDNTAQPSGLTYSSSSTISCGPHTGTPYVFYAGGNDRSDPQAGYTNRIGLKISCAASFSNPRVFGSVEPTLVSLNGLRFDFVRS